MIAPRCIPFLLIVAVGLYGSACASPTADAPEARAEQFADNKARALAADEGAKDDHDVQPDAGAHGEDRGAAARSLRKTIPADELPELGPCEDPGNSTACGILDADLGPVRVTMSLAPALMVRGAGSLEISGVRRSVTKQAAALLPCYAWAHEREGARTSEYDVIMKVAPDGRVAEAKLDVTDLAVGAAGCIEERVERWLLPAPQGGAATVIATMTFAASPNANAP